MEGENGRNAGIASRLSHTWNLSPQLLERALRYQERKESRCKESRRDQQSSNTFGNSECSFFLDEANSESLRPKSNYSSSYGSLSSANKLARTAPWHLPKRPMNPEPPSSEDRSEPERPPERGAAKSSPLHAASIMSKKSQFVPTPEENLEDWMQALTDAYGGCCSMALPFIRPLTPLQRRGVSAQHACNLRLPRLNDPETLNEPKAEGEVVKEESVEDEEEEKERMTNTDYSQSLTGSRIFPPKRRKRAPSVKYKTWNEAWEKHRWNEVYIG